MNTRSQELKELVQVNSDNKELIDAVIFNVVERCCEILQNESYKLEYEIYH